MRKHALPILNSRVATVQACPPRPADFSRIPVFSDAQDRRYRYVRISLTDRCNLACVYCMPPGGETEHVLRRDLLNFEEIARLARILNQGGIERIRFTGGEPLLRKDLVDLVRMVRQQTQMKEIVLTTNGTRLSVLAGPLKEAGLNGVNISLDSLHPDRFKEIRRGASLHEVIKGIDAALASGLHVKLNTVALGALNEDELEDIVHFAWARDITPRFIELMPLGEAAKLPAARFLSVENVKARLSHLLDAEYTKAVNSNKGPARYLTAKENATRRVGFITAMSEDFCDSCNRIRITAKGDVRACLADRKAVSLRDRMRNQANDLDVAWSIHWALNAKARGHFFQDPDVREHHAVGMSLIGG